MNKLLLSVLSCASAATLYAVDGVLLADSPSPATFSVYASDTASYVVTSLGDIAALPPVAWNAGDTVTAISGRGVATTLAESAVSADSVAFPPSSSGGVWTLVNSSEGTAKIGIPWFVYGDTGSLATSGQSSYDVDSQLSGPNRKTIRREVLPVAYSDVVWVEDVNSAVSLSFTSPSLAVTERSFDEAVTEPFDFHEAGVWNVQLKMDGSTVATAEIEIKSSGFQLILR